LAAVFASYDTKLNEFTAHDFSKDEIDILIYSIDHNLRIRPDNSLNNNLLRLGPGHPI